MAEAFFANSPPSGRVRASRRRDTWLAWSPEITPCPSMKRGRSPNAASTPSSNMFAIVPRGYATPRSSTPSRGWIRGLWTQPHRGPYPVDLPCDLACSRPSTSRQHSSGGTPSACTDLRRPHPRFATDSDCQSVGKQLIQSKCYRPGNNSVVTQRQHHENRTVGMFESLTVGRHPWP